MTDHLLTTKEVAALLSVTRDWVNRAAGKGEIPAYRVGGGWRFDADELGLWLTLRGNPAVEMPDNPRRRILPPPRPGRANPPLEPIVDLENSIPAEHVAAELDASLTAVRRWILEPILPGARAGRSWRVDAVAFEEWRQILSRHEYLQGLAPGRARHTAIRHFIVEELLHRTGVTYSVDSWQRRGGSLPTWAEAVVDPRRRARRGPMTRYDA